MGPLKFLSNSLLCAAVAVTGSLCRPATIFADTLTVAVAANFAETLEQIVDEFEATHQHEIRLVRGSSGNHYAQIVNGAPFDLFFSADTARPQALVNAGRVGSNQVADYAQGQLVLWAPSASASEQARSMLESLQFRRLAHANPKLAPYGRAAQDVLDTLALSTQLGPGQVVLGENVSQAYQFIATGNVALGFVALSQVVDKAAQQYWLIPQEYYQPIVQQLVVLNQSAAMEQFIDYFSSQQAQTILQNQGYKIPLTD